jgi:excisionase family DNA binding protein
MDHNNQEGENRGRIRSSRDQYRADGHTQQRWVAVAQVAEMLSITRREIYYMIEAGELPAIKIGRAVRIPLDALEQWIADKEVEAKESRSAYGSKARLG